MTDSYKETCKIFKIGSWSLNYSLKQISIDNNLVSILGVADSELSYELFLNTVAAWDRVTVKGALDIMPRTVADNYRITLLIGGEIYYADFWIDTSSVDRDSCRINGYVRFEAYDELQKAVISDGVGVESCSKHDLISEYKRVESELEICKKKLNKAVHDRKVLSDNISAALIFIDADYVVQWESTNSLAPLFEKNKAKFKNIIYKSGEICYKSAFQRDEPCLGCALTKMFASHKSVTSHYQEGGYTLEVIANPVYSQEGTFMGGVLKIENITHRIHQERKIRELNHIMDAILNNIPVCLFVKNPNDEFRYLYWNKAMVEYAKIDVVNVLGKTDFEVFPSMDDARRFRKDDLSLLEGGEKIEFQEVYTDADGEEHTVNTIKALIPSEEELPWLIGVSWDITNLKKVEKELIFAKEIAENNSQIKSTFLANMSHEIRTPLNAIVGFSELLMDESVEKEDRDEYMSIIKRNNTLLLQLISDVLDFSKIEARVLEFHYDYVNLRALCSEFVIANRLRNDNVVEVMFDDSADDYIIYSDPNRVHQVLANMVNNALKFTSEGYVKIGYKLLNEDEVEIYVEDTGVGIPADRVGDIFERFVKINSFVQGSGLGLPICKSLVTQLNGRIGVESKEGVGSRFWFTLPYKKENIC